MNITLSKEYFEDFIVKKLNDRLSQISWGINCETLKDALVFYEEWLLGEISEREERKEMEAFLLKEGFSPRKRLQKGKNLSKWYFPFGTDNPKFQEVLKAFERSLEEVRDKCSQKAKAVISKFGEFESYYSAENVENKIYRKILFEKVVEFNRKAEIRQTLFKSEPIIMYDELCNGNMVILFDDYYYEGLRNFLEDLYDKVFAAEIRGFFTIANMKLSFLKEAPIPKNLVTYIRDEYVHSFKHLFTGLGFEIEYIPKAPEIEYVSIGEKTEGSTALYIEVPKLLYCQCMYGNQELNTMYRIFCGFYIN